MTLAARQQATCERRKAFYNGAEMVVLYVMGPRPTEDSPLKAWLVQLEAWSLGPMEMRMPEMPTYVKMSKRKPCAATS